MNKSLRNVLIAFFVLGVVLLAGFYGYELATNQQEPKEEETVVEEADLSGIKEVASMTTVEALYHGVAKYTDDLEGLEGIWTHGYKKAWREYDASVSYGIDASKVSTSRQGNVVTVKMPRATLTKDPRVVNSGDLLVDTGIFTEFTKQDEKTMMASAEEDAKTECENDTTLINRATENAQKIMERWVQSMGKSYGEDLKVEFEIVS